MKSALEKRILAIGGGGFLMEDHFAPIDREIVRLCKSSRPTICLLPTPTGDAEEIIQKFYSAYDPWCKTLQLTPFRKMNEKSINLREFEKVLPTLDAVFVTGGNTKSALAVWKEWGIDRALVEAYNAGTLLCGMSAGAICWFEEGYTDSYGGIHSAIPCLGILESTCSVHHKSDSPRGQDLFSALSKNEVSNVLAIDDYAAVLYKNGAISKLYSWRSGASARKFTSKDGAIYESLLECEHVYLSEDVT